MTLLFLACIDNSFWPWNRDDSAVLGPGPEVEERCNGEDDNQDGRVDEGFADADADGWADCADPICDLSVGPPEVQAQGCEAEWTAPARYDWEEVWHWESEDGFDHNYGGSPLVVQLDDDNGDGRIDRDDVADIVLTVGKESLQGTEGRMVAISGATHTTLWTYMPEDPLKSSRMAAGDVDGDGCVEIVSFGDGFYQTDNVWAVDCEGTLLWASGPGGGPAPRRGTYSNDLRISDFDSDGVGEAYAGLTLRDALGNVLVSTVPWPSYFRENLAGGFTDILDLDGDGLGELVVGRMVVQSPYVLEDLEYLGGNFLPFAVDIDGDENCEVIQVVHEPLDEPVDGSLGAWRVDGEEVWRVGEGEVTAPAVVPIVVAASPIGALPAALVTWTYEGPASPPLEGRLSRLSILDAASGVERCGISGIQDPYWSSSFVSIATVSPGQNVILLSGHEDGSVIDGDCNVIGTIPGATGVSAPVITDLEGDGVADLLVAHGGMAQHSEERPGLTLYRPVEPWAPPRRAWTHFMWHPEDARDDNVLTPVRTCDDARLRAQGVAGEEPGAISHWPALPDLGLAGLGLCAECEGEEATLAGWVVNEGEATAFGPLRLWVVQGGERLHEVVFEGDLDPGGSLPFDLVLSGDLSEVEGTFDPAFPLELIVDPELRRMECDEDDNAVTLTASCPG